MPIQIRKYRRRLFKIMGASFLAAMLGVGLFNLVVDPYGIFRIVDIERFNHVKPYPDHDLETIKAYALRRVRPTALILGNSRAEIGFDPEYPAWRAAGYSPVYNAAIPGADLGAGWRLLKTSAGEAKPKFVLLGVDFFDFPILPEPKPEESPSGAGDARGDLLWSMRGTLTMQTLLDSATTLRRQFQANPAQLTELGFNPLLEYRDIARVEGYWPLFRQRAEENAKNHGRKPRNLFLSGTGTSPHFDAVRSVVRWARDSDVELTMVIYPYHVQLLLLIRELGLWPLYEEWKKEMTQIVDTEASASNHRIELIDFGVVSAYSVEAIPPKGDKTSATRWYWEAGHFKKELGDLILAQCLGQKASSSPFFGVPLSRRNIADHLATQSSALAAYSAEHPKLDLEVRDLVREARSRRAGGH